MKKVIKLKESDLKNIIRRILSEQVKENINPNNLKVGDGGRRNPNKINLVKQLQQKLMDLGFLKTDSMKPTGYFGGMTKSALDGYNGVTPKSSPQPASPLKPKNTAQSSSVPYLPSNNKNQPQTKPVNKPISKDIKSSKSFCPTLPSYKDVDMVKMLQYQSTAGELISKGVPTRSACEISYVSIRPKFSNKNFFVVDTRDNNIYLFNKEGKFVAKSYTIDGYNAQSQDAKKMAEALWSWSDYVVAAGFKYDTKEGKYKDMSGKNKSYSNDLIYDYIDKNKSRFFPKGIYSISRLKTDEGYVGGDNNVFNITTLDGKSLANAIHGFYNEAPRVKAMMQLKNAMGKSASPTSMSIPDSFIKMVEQYIGTSKFNKSYGCINLPEDFLKIAKPYAVGALVFVIGETNNNYLVQSDKFFDNMGQSEKCPNVESLGQILPKIDAVV
jgi:hypothetical protein